MLREGGREGGRKERKKERREREEGRKEKKKELKDQLHHFHIQARSCQSNNYMVWKILIFTAFFLFEILTEYSTI